MRKKQNKHSKNNMDENQKRITGLCSASFIGMAITVILTLFLSYILSKSPSISNSVNVFFIASILIGVFVCGFTASRLTRLKGIICGAASSVIYLLIITVIMLFVNNGRLAPTTLFMYLGALLLGIVGGILGANLKRKK